MEFLLCLVTALQVYHVFSEIRDSQMINKLIKVKPVGAPLVKSFLPLTEIPPPAQPHYHELNGRRHLVMNDDCTKGPTWREVEEGRHVQIIGDYYDDGMAKTLATIIFPDHIDHKHFEITTQIPYLTVGEIEAIGYHPSTLKNEHPSECEKIYQDHMEDQYSDELTDFSEESLEMARMPLAVQEPPVASIEEHEFKNVYSDLSM